jgi:copper transport protein
VWLGAAAPLLVALAAVAWFPVEAWAGGLGLTEVLALRQALVALIAVSLALVLAPALALAARGDFPAALALVVAVLLAAVPALSGHALAEDPAWPSVLGSWAHVAAAGLWGGGVLALAVGLPGALRAVGDDARPGLVAGVVGRFTRLALAGLAVLVASGAIGAYVYAGSLTAIVETDWGRLVLLKAALVVVAVAVAGLVRRRGAGSLRALAVETGIAIAIIVVTGVLTGLAPTGSAQAPPGPLAVTAQADGRLAQLTIAPGVAGAPNEVHLIVVDDRGAPAFDAADGSVVLTSDDVERLTVDLTMIEAGHWVGSVMIPTAGSWRVSARFRIGDFDDTALQGILVVAPPGG